MTVSWEELAADVANKLFSASKPELKPKQEITSPEPKQRRKRKSKKRQVQHTVIELPVGVPTCFLCSNQLRAADGHFHSTAHPVRNICCECAGCKGKLVKR